jgi:hypothetical protein
VARSRRGPAGRRDERSERGSQFWKDLIVGALDGDRVALFSQLVLAIADGARMQQEIAGSTARRAGRSDTGRALPADGRASTASSSGSTAR